MNDQNQVITEEQTLKRKRGRPRRSESINHGNTRDQAQEWDDGSQVNECSDEELNDELLGQVVSGVLTGTFDAGYFVTMRPQNSTNVLTGVVFLPGKVIPITPENDLAPHEKMYIRKVYDTVDLGRPNQLDGTKHELRNNNQFDLPVENQTPKSVNRSPVNQVSNDQENDTSKGYELSHRGLEFGVGNFYAQVEHMQDYRVVDQDEIMKEFEASACMNAPSSSALKPTTDQDKFFDVNERPSADDTTGSQEGLDQYNSFNTSEPRRVAQSDLKLGFTQVKCSVTTSPKSPTPCSKEVSTSTYEKTNPDKSSTSPFFINLTDISTETPTRTQQEVPDCFTLKPDQGISSASQAPTASDFPSDHGTQEAVSYELKLSATATPLQLSSPTPDSRS